LIIEPQPWLSVLSDATVAGMRNNERGSFGALDVIVILVIVFGLFGISLLIAAS
jgi:hypothetical protein